MAGIAFGSEMRKEFMTSPDVTPLNHGSWGACPRRVFDARVELLKEVESSVDEYHRYKSEEYWFENLRVVSEFLNLDFANTTFVPNATTGINTILKALPLKDEDEILVYTYTYGAIRNTTESAASRSGAKVVCLDMPYAIKSKQEVIDNFKRKLNQHPNIKVAVIDYISSPTATLFPVREMTALCRERNVISVIDGAHAPGQVKLDMDDIKPDFFVGNLHKWVYSPRGTAVLWISPKYQDVVRPLITSHYYKMEPFQKDYFYQATIDNTNYNVTKVAVEFYKEIGGIETVSKYITNLLDEAVEYLVNLWGTEKFPIPRDMEAPYLRLVRVPSLPRFPVAERNKSKSVGDHQPLMSYMIKEKKLHTVLLCMKGQDDSYDTYFRLSGQIYNTLDDYKKVGQEILKLSKEEV